MMLRVLVAGVLGVALACGCKAKASSSLPPAAGSGVQPPVIPALSELITDSAEMKSGGSGEVTVTGTLYPIEEAQLGPKASGVLSAVLVDEGDPVKRGQVMFRLEAVQAGLGVQQARTLLEAANVGLKSAELDYQRTRELHQRGSVPQATFDQMQARYDNAKNAVAQAQVALSMAQRASADTVVMSPIDGVVTAKLKNVGETVTMMPPTVVLVVQNVKVLELRTRLPDRNLAVLSPGTRLVVSFPALKIERTVDVARINPAVDALTRTVEIVARLDNADGRLKPGMLAEVQLASEVAEGASGSGNPPAPAASGAPASSGAVRNVATRKTP